MTSGVYAIVNTTNGLVYVGSSINIERRWGMRRSDLKCGRGGNKRLQRDWAKTQGEGFEWRILEETSPDETQLVEAEQRWIDAYRDHCYNAHLRARRWPNEDPVRNRIEGRNWPYQPCKSPYWDRPRRRPAQTPPAARSGEGEGDG